MKKKTTAKSLLNLGFEKCYSTDWGHYQYLFGKGTEANGLFLIIDLKDYSVIIGQLEHFSHSFGKFEYIEDLIKLMELISGVKINL